MKKLFTLAIISMIAAFTFAQAPTQKAKLSDRKIEKVIPNAEIKRAMDAKAVFEAKANAAQETSGSVLRKAVKTPSAAMNQMNWNVIPNVNARQVFFNGNLKVKDAKEYMMQRTFKSNRSFAKMGAKMAGEYVEMAAVEYSAEYYTSDQDWFCVFDCGSTAFRFDIPTPDPTPLNGTYTLDQMDPSYSWAGANRYNAIAYTEATFTVNAETGEAEAYVTLENGEKYHVTYTKPEAVEITEQVTYEFSAAQTELVDQTADYGAFQIIGSNDEGVEAYIAFYSDQLVGTYTIDDLFPLATSIYLNEDDYEGVMPFAIEATVTEEGATVIYSAYNGVEYTLIFHFTEEGGQGEEPAGNVTVTKDSHGIITSVTGGETKYYTRSASGTAYYYSGGTYFAEQSGSVAVVEDGEKVYIKDIVTRYTQGSWVEGTKSGNTVTVPAKQPLVYNTSYDTTISLRYGLVTADGGINAADSYADNFVYTVEGDVWTLQNTTAWDGSADAYFMGVFWDDDDSATGYGDAETVLTYDAEYVAPSTDLVVLPAGATAEAWKLNATKVSSSSSAPILNQDVQVAFVGSDVYVKGIFTDLANSWVKGTVNGTSVTFAKGQYLGKYGTNDIWFMGVDPSTGELKNAAAVLSADGKTITLSDDILANAKFDEVYYLSWLADAVLSAEAAEEPAITDLTAALPYLNTLETAAEQNEVAIYDANGDGKTWTIVDDSNYNTKCLRVAWNSSQKADDYAVFPGLTLKAGISYSVSVDARAYGTTFPERIEVVVGQVAKATDLNTVVIPATVLASKEYETLSADFVPEADGIYYFALHGISDADMFYLYADNFSVKENNPNTPMAVTGFVAEAGENGALTAKLTFTLPATTVSGGAMDMVEYAITRDGEEIILGAAAPGSTKTKTDTDAKNGVNNYTIVAKYNGLVSSPVSTSVYVGEDLPVDVENLVATDKNGIVGLTWDAVTEGEQGGYVNPANVTYNVYPVEMLEFLGMQFPSIDYENPYMTGLTETSADIEFDTNAGPQGYTYFGVTAENAAGESDGEMAGVLTGAAYDIPLHEGLTGEALHYWWGTNCDDDNYNADGGLYIGEDSSDGDGVSFAFVAETAGWIDLYSGKINLGGADNAGLSFDYMSNAAAVLNVVVVTPAGETTVKTIDAAASTEFATAKVSLADYSDQPWVRFTIHAEFAGSAVLSVDNVNVMDFIADNLSVSLSAPKSVVAGQSAIVKATVKNEGENAAEGYDVKFYINDVEAAAPLFETPALGFLETAEFEFELETSIFDEVGDVVVKAEVVYAADLKADDNADETVVTVVAPSATPVESVDAEFTSEGILVSWTVAESAAAEITEDFESYEVGIFDENTPCGAWTGFDGDKGTTYGWESTAINWPYTQAQFAFAVANAEEMGLSSSVDIQGNSALFFSIMETTAADKWMISPALPGMAQTITFTAQPMTAQYGPEILEIMASSTTADPASFTKVAEFSIEEEAPVQYTAELPEGTLYFAFHYVSADVFCLFVDDVKYTAGGSAPTGFNIYVDQNLVATLDADATSYLYTGALAAPVRKVVVGSHSIAVTAVYNGMESAPVSVDLENVTGIENVTVNSAVEVYTVDGLRVNAKDLKSGVYVVNGQKQVVK